MGGPAHSDEELLLALKRFDEKAFQMVYEKYAGKIFGFLRVKSPKASTEELQDRAQKVWVKLYRSIDQVSLDYPLEQTLFVIARSVWLDELKARKRKDHHAQEYQDQFHVDAQKGVTADEQSERWSQVFSEVLTPEQRKVLERKVFDEKKYSEIASELGRTEVAIRKIYSRAVQALKKKVLHEPS